MHPQGPYGGYGAPQVPPPGPAGGLPDPERGRRWVGLGCWTLGMIGGLCLLFLLFVLFPVATDDHVLDTFKAMAVGAVLAFPAALMYLTVPRILDRYDPEPAYALVMALLWGGVAACGVSALVNSLVGAVLGEAVGAVISAPIVEEGMKGLLVLGLFFFLKREFDGVVDGIIYATFCAIGFAAVENVVYYGRAGLSPQDGSLVVTFMLRGVLAPWGHPLYTSMTGIGLGIARETSRPWLKVVAPLAGYAAAVFLHAVWNGSSVVLGAFGLGGNLIFLFVLLPLWLVFVGAFLIMVIVLVRRRGKIIRSHLIDEVALGHLSQEELDLVASAFGGLVAYFRKGSRGTEFVRAVARLALSKWHTARAVKGKTTTVSMDFILPLRKKIRALREQGHSPARQLPQTRRY